jgi:hypothetical protein
MFSILGCLEQTTSVTAPEMNQSNSFPGVSTGPCSTSPLLPLLVAYAE